MKDRVLDTLVIGGGQTGLTVGYELARTGRTFVILDANKRVGDAWRNRWDSLLLFTPTGFFKLPGLDIPGPSDRFVTKDETADIIEQYARDQSLPVLSDTKVTRLTWEGGLFTAETAAESFHARNVVVAMAKHQDPKVPALASQLKGEIRQLHSSDYKSVDSLQQGPTLVVGMGNSGAEIGLEIARDRETYVSGQPTAIIPFRIDNWFGRRIGVHMITFIMTKVLTTSTPMGRRARRKMLTSAAPVVRARPKDIVAAGGQLVPRVTAVRDGQPEVADGRVLDVDNVVWCTGFRPSFEWIDLPVLDESGLPRHSRGVSDDVPGLYFCGLHFQHAAWSETVVAMPRDARYVVEHLDTNAEHTTDIATRGSTSVAGP